MRKGAGIAGMILCVALAGCAPRTVYDSFRFRQQLDCQQLRGADRDACLKRSEMSYDEYQRRLKEEEPGK